MSFAALASVSKMRVETAAEKLVALAYADCHNEETGCAYPSLAWLCEFSSLNRKTVIAAVMRLERSGLLTDTGERRGNTRQIKVYRVNLEEQSRKRNSTENGTVPKSARKESQKRDTEPVREPISQKTTSSSIARASSPPPKQVPIRMPEDWQPVRFSDGTVAREVIDRRGIEWARAAVESFRNWAANADDKSGKGRKRDWQKAWSNWVIEQDRRDGRGSGQRMGGYGGGGAAGSRTLAAGARFLERHGASR